MSERKNSLARIKANTKYNKKSYDTIQIRAKKTERIGELIDMGAARAGASKAGYVLDAIRARLNRDGITAADLPPLPEDQTE